MAQFADLKSPFTTGHSGGVSDLAAAAATRCRLPEADVAAVRHAALVHDLGRVGVPNGIWDKPGPLSSAEWEQVRLHPYYGERVLARSSGLARLGAVAGLHHERVDGGGYHRGMPGTLLPPPARILAAADVYYAMTEPRPYRPALTPDRAAAELRRAVRAGHLDGTAAEAVLEAAGHRVHRKRDWPSGLSAREVEVLRLVARGLSNRAIAGQLVISESTVAHHVQHVYTKIGVATRAGATLFAMQHALLDPADSAET
jgi:HD-GYP domain-containing protein (c-di-GMP phosphodiesterase class II)/DNA-binding CsgD family transcriptional regulator